MRDASASHDSWQGYRPQCRGSTEKADMMTCVRRAIWPLWFLQTPEDREGFAQRSQSLQDTILYALAPAQPADLCRFSLLLCPTAGPPSRSGRE